MSGEASSNARRPTGRGSDLRPPNRFQATRCEGDWEHLEGAEQEEPAGLKTEFLPDQSRTIIRENDSPDISSRYSVNPYRGCEHGCAYCYARPTHETLGLDAGLDFESRILVKHGAAELLRRELNRPRWSGAEPIMFSGVTDCYQPIERKLRITRGCLEVLAEAHQAVGIVTKNALVTRDLDLLAPMAEQNLVRVFLSVTSLDAELCRRLEPRTSSPQAKLAAIAKLREAGVPVGAMIAPVIPGLNDSHIAATLEAVAAAGADVARYTLLRLPLAVAPIFQAWLERHAPEAKERVLARVRDARGGKLNDSQFGRRMSGRGPYAEQIAQSFEVFRRRSGLSDASTPLDCSRFRRPALPGDRQRRLF